MVVNIPFHWYTVVAGRENRSMYKTTLGLGLGSAKTSELNVSHSFNLIGKKLTLISVMCIQCR